MKKDVEGQPDVANVFRNTAEGETGHAFGKKKKRKRQTI